MTLFSILAAPAVAFALAPAGAVQEEANGELQDRVASRSIEMQTPPASVLKAVAQTVEDGELQASPVRLVSWDGDFELMKSSRRMRIWRTHVAYRLDVDPEGKVTNCELTETFRRRRVSDRLCEILSAHHTFQPAHDESGVPVAGTYAARMSYQEIRERM